MISCSHWGEFDYTPPPPCDHPHEMRFGLGRVGSDGSSKSTTFCRKCGKSWVIETPPRPAAPQMVLPQNWGGL